MTDWQMNSVQFIQQINGHGHDFAINVAFLFPTSSVSIKTNLANVVLTGGCNNNMRHKIPQYPVTFTGYVFKKPSVEYKSCMRCEVLCQIDV